MHNGEAESDINCLLRKSVCARGSPCIVSYTPRGNRAGRGMQPHLTNVETGGSERSVSHWGSQSRRGRKPGTRRNLCDPEVHATTG